MRGSLSDDPVLIARRELLAWMAGSPVLGALASAGCSSTGGATALGLDRVRNVFDLEDAARRVAGRDAMAYLAGGADDMRTLALNHSAYAQIGIRPRRLVDVRTIDTSIELFGQRYASPILLAPIGFQGFFHPYGEIASARAAARVGFGMIVSSVSTYAVEEIARAGGRSVWFQLYPTPNRDVTRGLLRRAEAAGSPVVALTVDTPVAGNRERHGTTLAKLLAGGELRMGNYEGLRAYEPVFDTSMTWDMVSWLKENSSMKVVLKGIVTHEDATLAVEHGADGLIVSNHGGRQLESDQATIDALPEVIEAVAGRLPVLIDGGIRRGTDVFKALARGADAVCIGRPYCWGLAAYGEPGVAKALTLLQRELVLDMQLAGTTELAAITRAYVT